MPFQISSTQLNSIPTADHPKVATVPRAADFGDLSEALGLPRNHPSLLQIELAKKWTDPSGRTFGAGQAGIQHTNSAGTHVVFGGTFPLQDELKADDVADEAPQLDPEAPVDAVEAEVQRRVAAALAKAPRAPKAPKAPRRR